MFKIFYQLICRASLFIWFQILYLTNYILIQASIIIQTNIQKRVYINKMHREESEINIKRANFRESIRRKQIQQIFSSGRMRFQEDQIKQQMDIIMQQVDTQQKRKKWIYQKSKQLGYQPQKCWFPIIRALSISTKVYNGDYSDWINSGVIQKLVKLFKQQYLELKLSQIAACTLYDIFYYIEPNSPQAYSILQFEFISDLVELCVPPNTQIICYLELINGILSHREHLRDKFINNGIVQILTTKLKMYQNYESDEVFAALCLCYRLAKVFKHNEKVNYPKGNVLSIFIPILDKLLVVIKREDSLFIVLQCFSNLAVCQKQYVLTALFNSPNLIYALLHFLVFDGEPKFRLISATTLAAIAGSKNVSFAQELVKKGLLDYIVKCSSMQNNETQCISSLLQLISNVAANGLIEAKNLLDHQAFHYVIYCSKDTERIKIFSLVVYILTTLIAYQNYQISQILIRKYKVLQILISGLCVNAPVASTCMQIIHAIIKLIIFYGKIYTGSQNKIIYELEMFYNIDKVLQELESKIGNKKVHQKITMLYSALHGEYNDMN